MRPSPALLTITRIEKRWIPASKVRRPNDSGAIYALDMGEEFKILDLARNLIRLAGYVPDEDIRIEFTGLRPGEKLSETLGGEGEALEAAVAGKTGRVRSKGRIDTATLSREVGRIEEAAARGVRTEVVASLARLVPTLAPAQALPVEAPISLRGHSPPT